MTSGHYGLTAEQRADRDTVIRQLRADGVSIQKIADQIGCTGRTIQNVLNGDLSTSSASHLDDALRREARTIASSMVRFKELITTAKEQNIYEKLGFVSWTAYVADVIGREMSKLPVDDRRQIVELLTGEGMSNRQIAEAVGVDEITVRRDKDGQVRHDVAPDKVTGADGKSYPAKPKPKPRPELEPPRPAAPVPDVPAPGSEASALCALCGDGYPVSQLYDDAGGFVCEQCVDPGDGTDVDQAEEVVAEPVTAAETPNAYELVRSITKLDVELGETIRDLVDGFKAPADDDDRTELAAAAEHFTAHAAALQAYLTQQTGPGGQE